MTASHYAPDTIGGAPTWHKDAACARPGVDPDDMFPGQDADAIAAAKAICHSCPVTLACLQAALDEEAGSLAASRWGIRGGLTPGQRRGVYERGLTAAQALGRAAARNATHEEAMRAVLAGHTEPTADGHVRWFGPHPTIQGRRYTAARLAFHVTYGRAPVGIVTRTCGRLDCVEHLADEMTRNEHARQAVA